jgi:hypothetical protein
LHNVLVLPSAASPSFPPNPLPLFSASFKSNVLHTPYCRSLHRPPHSRCPRRLRHQLSRSRSGDFLPHKLFLESLKLTALPVHSSANPARSHGRLPPALITLLSFLATSLAVTPCSCRLSKTRMENKLTTFANSSVEIGDFDGTFTNWVVALPAGKQVVLSLVDAQDNEAWSKTASLSFLAFHCFLIFISLDHCWCK